MPERDRAAVDVGGLRVGAEHRERVERDRAERLVHLDALHVADRLARLLERLRARVRRRAREPRELVRDVALRDDRGQRLEPAPLRELLRAHDDAGGAVVDAGRVAGRDRPFGIHRGLQGGELLERRVAAHRLVGRHLADGNDLVVEAARVLRRRGALVRAKRPRVLVLARDAELAGDLGRLLHHVQLVERRAQPVPDHQVDERPVAHPVALSRLRQRVRRVRHRLHAAGDDDLDVAGADHRVGDLDRADRGGADLVHRVGRDVDRDPGADRRLARRSLSGAGLQHLAHDHVVDLAALEADALEARADRDRAELGRGIRGEAAVELAERRPDRGDDDGAAHGSKLAREGHPGLEPARERHDELHRALEVVEVEHLDRRVHVAERHRDDARSARPRG